APTSTLFPSTTLFRSQRRLVGGPSLVDRFVVLGVMKQQRRLNLRHVLRVGLAAVKRHRGGEFGIRHSRGIRHAAAITKAGDADRSEEHTLNYSHVTIS